MKIAECQSHISITVKHFNHSHCGGSLIFADICISVETISLYKACVPITPLLNAVCISLCRLHLLNAAGISLSAGVGRSGTFVALLWLMQLCVRGIMPDVRAAVQDLRRHRVMMVQNLEQYILVHQCLMHWLSGGSVGPLSRVQSHAGPAHVDQGQDHPFTTSRRSGQGNPSRGRRRRQQHTPHPVQTQPQTQSSVQQLLNPRNLLRRLLPPSIHINPQKHTED